MSLKCDRCDSPATVHLIEIKGGQKVEKHLCERHAVEEGVAVKMNPAPLNDLLEKFVLKHAGGGVADPAELSCGQCGLTYEEFRRTGLLGCPDCYQTFETALAPLLERAHEGATRHVGKAPSRAGIDDLHQQRLRQLRRELDEAVAAEQYERAARLRDQLNQAQVEPEK